MSMRLLIMGGLLAWGAAAQDFFRQLDFKGLASRAAESVEVNLDQALLKLATQFLGEKGDEGQAKQVLKDLKAVHVRTFKFDKEGEYSTADVDQIRRQVTAAGWSSIVDVRTSRGGDNTGVYIKTNGVQIEGIVVVAAEKRELTVVNVVGNIDPSRLREIGGRFGVPRMEFETGSKQQKKSAKDDQE